VLDFGMLTNEVDHVDFLVHFGGLNFKNTSAVRGILANELKKLTARW
jgi:hypothetical protein